MYPKIFKQKIIDLYKKYKNVSLISSILNISKSSIYRWLNGSSFNKKKYNRYSVLKDENIINFIKNIIKKNPYIYLKDITKNISKKFNKKITLSYVHKILSKIGISRKKVVKKSIPKNKNNLNILTKKFKNDIKKIKLNNIYSIDETYVHLNIKNNYGRSKKGTRIIQKNKVNQKKYSLIMTISTKRIIDYKIYDGNINGNKFKNFLLNKTLKSKNKKLLMDNVKFHKTNFIKQTIKNSKNETLFIPPYSPEYNPIEYIFSKIKRKFREYNSKFNIKNIKFFIKRALKTITEEDLKNCFNKSLVL